MADLLDMEYINSLPQPFMGRELGGWWWPINDFEAATGLLRIDVMGKLEAKHIGDFTAFRDGDGVERSAEAFYSDANEEERAPVAGVPPVSQASDFNPDWSMLEATQESLREHMAMIRDLQSRVSAAAILAKQVSSALAEANVPASVKNDVHELRRVLFIPSSAVPSGVTSGSTVGDGTRNGETK